MTPKLNKMYDLEHIRKNAKPLKEWKEERKVTAYVCKYLKKNAIPLKEWLADIKKYNEIAKKYDKLEQGLEKFN